MPVIPNFYQQEFSKWDRERLYDIDPISIEVTNPSVFTKEPNYVMPVIPNFYQQEFSKVDRELFNMNKEFTLELER